MSDIPCSECWIHAHPCGYINKDGSCSGFVTKEQGIQELYSFALSQSKRTDVCQEYRDIWANRAAEIKSVALRAEIHL